MDEVAADGMHVALCCEFGGSRLTVRPCRRGFLAGEVIFADVLMLPNGMSKVGAYV